MDLTRFPRKGTVATAAVLVTGALLAGCGSSSSSSTTRTRASSSTTQTNPAAATPDKTPIRGASAHPGKIKPSRAALALLVRVPKGAGFAPHISGLSTLPLDQQMTVLDNDIDTFWNNEFAGSNVQWPQAEQVLIRSGRVKTGCSDRPTIGPKDPWFLCDPTFFWPLPWIKHNVASKGDVNLAFNVAEMWSFHVQNVLGFTQLLEQGGMSKGQWARQTLCLTGLWVRSLSQRNLFEQGDTRAASNFLEALSNVNGITTPDVTPQALQQAFLAGYNSGAPSTCGVSSSSATTTTTPTTTTTTPTTPGVTTSTT